MNPPRCLAISILLHLAALLALAGRSPQLPPTQKFTATDSESDGDDGEDKRSKPGTIIAKSTGIEPKDDCKDSYEGIGVVVEWNGTVTSVVPGYPAHRAGLRVGDNVGPGDPLRFRGPIGTVIELEAIRNGTLLRFSITRAKICTT